MSEPRRRVAGRLSRRNFCGSRPSFRGMTFGLASSRRVEQRIIIVGLVVAQLSVHFTTTKISPFPIPAALDYPREMCSDVSSMLR